MNQHNVMVKQDIQVLDHSFLNAFQVLKKCRDDLHPLLQMLLYLSEVREKNKKEKKKAGRKEGKKEMKKEPCNCF